MKKCLEAVQARLSKIESIATRRKQIEGERGELQTRANDLTKQIASGNAKAVTDQAIARARLEVSIPEEFSKCQAEHNATIAELRGEFLNLGKAVGAAYAEKTKKTQAEVEEFLARHMDAHPDRDDLRDKITDLSRDVIKHAQAHQSCHPGLLSGEMSESDLLRKCKNTLYLIKDLI